MEDNGCPWEARDLCISAAVGGRIDVLVYLQQKGLLTSAALLTNMLDYAGAKDRLAAMQCCESREQSGLLLTNDTAGVVKR
jgi:hypothetical protein